MQKTYCYALILFVLNFACVSHAQFSVVYNFGTNPNDPVQPFYAGIISQGQDGNLYSAGYGGGGLQGGATFRMTPGGVITPLWDFANNGDGAIPTGGLILGTDGNFYGTTYDGGFGLTPYGTIFQMTPSGGLSTLYDFQDGNDGALPEAPPVEGLDGNYYGTNCPSCNGPIATGSGSIYVITPPPSSTFSVVYPFDGIHGSEPMAPLILGTDGKFCGVTGYGGTNGCSCGVIFKVTPTGNLTVLYNFDNAHGEIPIGSLVQGKDGNFYGTTTNGGANGLGVVFKVTPKGKLTVLHDMDGTNDGQAPYAGMVQATDGNFYGVNAYAGPGGCGTIFKITPKGSFSVVYPFDNITGCLPYSTLMQHTNGLIYGMTQTGGTGGLGCGPGVCGVMYSVNIGAKPFVSIVQPFGKAGTTVGIRGQGFTGATQVAFNKVPASFSVLSDTYLTAAAPAGVTTGFVTVKIPHRALKSNRKFNVVP